MRNITYSTSHHNQLIITLQTLQTTTHILLSPAMLHIAFDINIASYLYYVLYT